MRQLRSLLVLGAGLLAVASPLSAQEYWGRGGLEINGYYGVLNGLLGGETENDPDQWRIDNNHYFGGRLGYTLRNGLGIEGFFGYLSGAKVYQNDQEWLDNEVTAMNYGGDLVYNFNLEKNFQLAIMAGAGWSNFEFDYVYQPDLENPGSNTGTLVEPGTEGAFTWNYGAAAKFFFTRSLAFRVDWRNYVSPDGLDSYRCTLNGYYVPEGQSCGDVVDERVLEDKTLQFTEFTAGLSLFLGGPKDTDGDGVPDERDLCPDTPKGVEVDENGCPFDDDMDGVPNYIDQCPDTPRGATVDANGCPMDADGDGVYDGLDQCPNTPAGATVDSRGCPVDSDGDGVFDGIDQCPNTPRGAAVDARGCPMDTDGDGVYDGIDQCPGTPAGAEVDANGCTVFQAGLAAGEIVLEGIQFRVNSAELTEASQATLDVVGAAIVGAAAQEPGLKVEVQGHASSDGNDAYNMQLSERRAKSVRDYLVSKHASLDDVLTSKGYGETQPIASNDTPEGREKNRRVEFEVMSR
jgi:OOP family OmpA-OmpF porin